MKKSGIKKYFKEYKWSNIFAMIKNNSAKPKICSDDYKGKLVVITGATSGIGYHTARKYASMGANLLTINRNIQKSEKLCREIEDEFGVKCDYKIADLSILKDIHNVADELVKIKDPIDVLIHNAGIFLTKKEINPNGIEKVFVVHYLSSFIINYRLMNKLKAQGKARIIFVGSEGHRFAAWGIHLDDINWEKHKYTGLKSYGTAKVAQLLSMFTFEEKFKDSGVTIISMHPGAVKSQTGKENGKIYRSFRKHLLDKNLKDTNISAEALYYLGVSKEVEGITAKFFNLTTLEEPSPPALDKKVAYELWDKSIKLAQL
ncbi:MAG: SDR family NAD(P)-dependent oxidoreductase [Candidatus Neomarinimicrobiota bacterium]|jgi:short-subunit dehydrogenase